MIEQLFSTNQLTAAYKWLCEQRKNYPDNADIWHLRFNWESIKPQLLEQLNCGNYQFSPMQKLTKQSGKTIHLWSSKDSLVIKCMAMRLTEQLNLSKQCTHIKAILA